MENIDKGFGILIKEFNGLHKHNFKTSDLFKLMYL